MTDPLDVRAERLDSARHDVSGLASGNVALDRWLSAIAGQSQRRDAVRTFVGVEGDGEIIGYYALTVGDLDHEQVTDAVRRGLSPHFPIPVAILARLAVDERRQGRGLGAWLLRDALSRVVLASEHLAIRAVVVHAVDHDAADFYRHNGFRALGEQPRTLMVTLAELRAAGFG